MRSLREPRTRRKRTRRRRVSESKKATANHSMLACITSATPTPPPQISFDVTLSKARRPTVCETYRRVASVPAQMEYHLGEPEHEDRAQERRRAARRDEQPSERAEEDCAREDAYQEETTEELRRMARASRDFLLDVRVEAEADEPERIGCQHVGEIELAEELRAQAAREKQANDESDAPRRDERPAEHHGVPHGVSRVPVRVRGRFGVARCGGGI